MKKNYSAAAIICACWLGSITSGTALPPAGTSGPGPVFQTADFCISCHTGMITHNGRNVSFGPQWQATMMANSGRDPYWMAGVRREIADHPGHRALIEDECSACHLPMARYLAKVAGRTGEVFANLAAGPAAAPHAMLAVDGVSCTLCHQLSARGSGKRESFTANFQVETPPPGSPPIATGPFEVDNGRRRVMFSSSTYIPAKADHIQEAGLCASCHTLFTAAFGPNGETTGELPEQVPYLEWEHSAYRQTKSCQVCHMPVIPEAVPVTPVLPNPRQQVSAHSFPGGNFFMMRMLNAHRQDLGITATPEELDAAARRTEEHLTAEAATVTVTATRQSGRLVAGVTVRNLAGHKLPTAYPSRRAWLHVTVRGRDGNVIFESGAPAPDGSIAGNNNDTDAKTFEPHYLEITGSHQVQIYEAVMGDPQGAVTTGLLTAVSYLKDNRLLPAGFDKESASKDVAVHGAARDDADFRDGGDTTRYVVDVSGSNGPLTVQVQLCYQTIGYRWAKNLAGREDMESARFLRYYDGLAAGSAIVLAAGTATAE